LLPSFAAFEKALHKERQREGIAQAQARGLYKGKAHSLGPRQIAALIAQRAAGVPIREIMRTFNLSKASVYRYLSQGRGEGQEAAD
jgi:DNA invertase Pin-like site-specific DNA recombinase